MSREPLRLLFASVHSYLDPSSGAARATRDILELLAARGADCRALAGGLLDFEAETTLESVLDSQGLVCRDTTANLGAAGSARVLDLVVGGVRVALAPTASSRPDRGPTPEEADRFLALADRALASFRPHVVLAYGGHPAGLELMRRARRAGAAVVFHLHNFGYDDPRAFEHASAVLVPSAYSARHHKRLLGIECAALPYPLRADRVVAADSPAREHLAFVNPQPAKGAAVFAAIAAELGRRRPDIPLLVVEGRGRAGGLADLPVDLSRHPNLHRMATTAEPRQFWAAARAVLVPSLWRESFGRVAAEGLANGLPVLASDRGALPATLGDAGCVLHVPHRYTPATRDVPTPREVAPWVAAVERLWDDPAFEAGHRERARAEARRWDECFICDEYERLFAKLIFCI